MLKMNKRNNKIKHEAGSQYTPPKPKKTSLLNYAHLIGMIILLFWSFHIIFIIISERLIMSVKVAIRVRPFNQREKFLGCISCVDMRQNTTILYQNRQKNKKQHYFTFDYSLWSHDEFLVKEDGYMYPATNKYVDQQKIYNLIGREILDNAWQGYNCCLFAYGQTGAGKSYSMIGYGVNRGVIPMVCQEIFQRIKKYERKGEKEFQITLSMLEIYNEKVQDLFVSTNKRPQNGLKIRQNKTLGVYVEGLTKHEVFSYMDIEKRMDQGSKNRSLASTLMNEYSSRAHTIIMIEFIQKEWINKLKMNKKSSYVNLVDLAGSERVAKTGIIDNKDRLKEASNINKSLHTLGRVIEILAQQSAGKKNTQVPYRDSALTRILQNALGGNSKTIMICAISPANDNYEETLSTLRYADQTKKIKNKPIVNESAVDKIIRELREENERLKKMLETSQENSPMSNTLSLKEPMTENEKKEMRSNVRASMREVQKQIKKNLKSFAINTDQIDEEEDSLMMTEFIDLEEPSQFFSELSFDLGNKAQVYITNLNEDELLNYKVRYSCEKDLLITNKNNKKNGKGMQNFAKIVLCGLGIEENHAKITKVKDRYFIQSLSETSAEYTLHNGKPVYEKKQLEHNDRIILGINSVFIFKNNLRKMEGKDQQLDYEYAINERQQEMENISLISPTSLNLFLSNNLLRSNSKQMYGGPPIQAYNNTKKLLEQQNDTQIMEKLSEIQLQFSKLVKENEEKIKEKEDFYRGKLNELKKEKEKEKEEKSTLQEKLMIKSIESQTLKTKNQQLEKLKKKLSKYNEEKNRRKKCRQSMLIGNDQENGIIQEDIIGQFIEVQDPNSRKAHKIGVGPNQQSAKRSKNKESPPKNNRNSGYNYEQVNIEQYEDNEEVINVSIGRQHNESLLLLDQQPEQQKNKKNKQRQLEKVQELRILREKNELLKKEVKIKKIFQFRRLYNIKLKCQVEIDTLCTQCLKTKQVKQQSHPIDNSFIERYLPNSMNVDAELEEYTYKGKEKKKAITHEEMLFLEQQIIELQSKLIAKESINNELQTQAEDMLLNFSMERLSQGFQNRKSSFQKSRRDSYADFELNLTQELHSLKSKAELKVVINDFIQILGDIPSLNVSPQSSLKILPTPIVKPKLKYTKLENVTYHPTAQQKSLQIQSYDDLNIQIVFKKAKKQLQIIKAEDFHFSSASSIQKLEKHYKIQHQKSSFNESLLLNEDEQQNEIDEEEIIIRKKTQTKSKKVNKQQMPAIVPNQTSDYGTSTDILSQQQKIVCQFGINTEINDYQINDKEKMNSFTAFLNEQLEQTRQNNTEFDSHSNQNIQVKHYTDVGVNCQKETQIIKESFQVQVGFETAEADVVTDINMESYEEFRNHQGSAQEEQQEELVGEDRIKEQQRQFDEQNVEHPEETTGNPNDQEEYKPEMQNEENMLQEYLEKQEQVVEEKAKDPEQQDIEVEEYLQVTFANRSIITSNVEPQRPELIDCGTNSQKIKTKDQRMNTSKLEEPELAEIAVNTSNQNAQVQAKEGENVEYIENYLKEQVEEQQMNQYLENRQQQENKDYQAKVDGELKTLKDVQEQSQRNIAKIAEFIIQNKIKSLNLISHSFDHMVYEQPQQRQIQENTNISQPSTPNLEVSPIDTYKESPSYKSVNDFKGQKFDIINEAINILIDSKLELRQENELNAQKQERLKVEMVDEQVQTKIQKKKNSLNNNSADHIQVHEDSHNNSSSNDFDIAPRRMESSQTQFENKVKESLNNSQQFADKFNLSFSEIAKNDMSYQQSVMGFDGLLKQEKEEELNHKIRQLEDKIKELESKNQQFLPTSSKQLSQSNTQKSQKQEQPQETIPSEDAQQAQYDNQEIKESLKSLSKKEQNKSSRYIPLKKNRKKKKKNQMTQQQRKEQEIQKEIQAKIIQCNNQNIINERNLQIHKRKREAEQLRKILIKKEKVELQKQLLLLIPMIRRFNLIAREMKRLIEAKISVQYRNFSHYEMIEVLKSYSANKKSGNNNIQIKIVVLNCEQGRIYTWPADVFKNRYEIAEQIFEKYLESSEDTKALGLDQRNQKAKDPFWDPIDFVPQGIGYLSMEVLLYNLSYEGYISLIYRSNIIAKIYVSITPVKVKKHHEESVEEEQSELDYMEIFNIRSLLEKDLYFTVSIESIKFMESEDRQKLDDSSQNINLTSLNSNIIKYNISYELLEMDYKLVTFTTHDVDFVADKQFKRIDYLRRHTFQNISESTLAYISDCPIKFTLNVMKDYNEEVVNASFNNEEYSEDNDHSELDKSMTSGDDKNSVRSRQNSLNDVGEMALKRGDSKKSDFTKKPAVIYENTELINKLETDAKKEQEKRDKIKKLEESKSKHGKAEKGEKDKQCNIY